MQPVYSTTFPRLFFENHPRREKPIRFLKPYRFKSIAVCFFTLLYILFSTRMSAQKFPENTNEFVDKLGEFMTLSKRPDMVESFTVFKRKHKDNAFSEGEMKHIISVANLMGNQNLQAFPYFKNYINALVSSKNDPDTTLFRRWHSFVEESLAGLEKGRTKSAGQLLEFSVDFMQERALKSGEGGSATWKIKGGKFDFAYSDREPMLVCTGVDLIGTRKTDSVTIKNTSGIFKPFLQVWTGDSGKVSWAEAGMDSSIYALLTKYKVEVQKPLFSCDTATLFYPLYFKEGIKGSFENNIVVRPKAASAKADSLRDVQFPRFQSFEKVLKINRIGDNIEYLGGFKLSGNSLYGYGTGHEPAQMTVYNKKREKVFHGKSQLFIIRRGVSVVSENVDAKLFMDADSLFHPAADFRIDIPKQIITLLRGEKGSSRNPFYSSFYNMNLNTDKLAWHLNSDSLEIGGHTGIKGVSKRVEFESSNYYDPSVYLQMQGLASHNSVSTLYSLWQKTDKDKEDNGRIVTDNQFAMEINPNFDYSSIQSLLAQMVEQGFINYYFSRHEIELRDKCLHYALASQGKKDFDAINIISESTGSNAKLNLKTKETEIYDVKKLELSQRQKVALIPNENELTLLKNRDMRFGGRLYAGLALFQGRDMSFVYDKFEVDFDSVQHLDFYIPTGLEDKHGQPIANAMSSNIEHLSGALLVDAPNNKSGKEEMAIFPSLQSKKFSFVFYDQPKTQGGVYTRDSFYFRLDPFSFNGLDSYTKDQLKFNGQLFPATIFPPFKETIIVREEDKSFGFIHKTPVTGYSTYSKKGNYIGSLDLSNKGLIGKGKLEYLTADIESEDLVFRPKQTTGTAKKFFMEEDRASKVKVPQARGEEVSVNWLPFKDSMYVTSKVKAFELFKASGYTHKGILILTPSGLKGKGEFEWAEGKLSSKIISYGPFQASVDTGNLEIKSLDQNGIALDSRNVDGDLDFDVQKGQFKANLQTASTTLPLDKYLTSMNEFTWNMKAKTIEFKADPNKPGRFVSIDPNQDTLAFEGKTALYDLKTNLLRVGGVKQIKSADAFVNIPDTSDIFIQPGGRMRTIYNAQIVADTISRYHTINRATVDIGGKKLYKATGYYEYNIPGYNQEVFFNDIQGKYQTITGSNRRVQTFATAEIPEKDSFRVDVKTLFKGDMILNSSTQNMTFKGYAQLNADKLPKTNWFTLQTEIDRKAPLFRIKLAKDPEDSPMVTGFYLSRETGEMYPRIMLPALQRVDRALIDCKQVYKYDPANDRFIFGDSLKVLGKSELGPKLVFDNRVGTVQADGPLNIGSGLDLMHIKSAGRLKSDYNSVTDSTYFSVTGEIISAFDIPIPAKLIDLMINEIKAAAFDAQPAIYNTNMAFYQPALHEFVSDEKDWEETLSNARLNAILLPRKDDKFAIVLGRQSVTWNKEYTSFFTLEDRIPLISIAGQPINKSLNIMVQYKMPNTGNDALGIYIKPSADLWYLFVYQNTDEGGALSITSSSPRFNDLLASLKGKDIKMKMADGKTLEVVPVDAAEGPKFVNKVRNGRLKD
ncbi:MAG: hypothetical protein ACKVT2_18365 [Saprospiraceae bacterium]